MFGVPDGAFIQSCNVLGFDVFFKMFVGRCSWYVWAEARTLQHAKDLFTKQGVFISLRVALTRSRRAAGLGSGLAGGGAVEQESAFAGVLGEGSGEFELSAGFGVAA